MWHCIVPADFKHVREARYLCFQGHHCTRHQHKIAPTRSIKVIPMISQKRSSLQNTRANVKHQSRLSTPTQSDACSRGELHAPLIESGSRRTTVHRSCNSISTHVDGLGAAHPPSLTTQHCDAGRQRSSSCRVAMSQPWAPPNRGLSNTQCCTMRGLSGVSSQ
jgi:hypothetical protein